MTGYRTRAFPEGSIVVFDWLEIRRQQRRLRRGRAAPGRRDGQGLAAFRQDWRRSGFQRFVKDSKETAQRRLPRNSVSPATRSLKQDGLILSSYRP